MQAVLSLFPANDFSLIAVILGMPLLGAFINGVWGKRLGKDAVRLMALSAIAISFFAALVTVIAAASASAGSKPRSRIAAMTSSLLALPLPQACRFQVPTGTPP